MDEGVLRVPYEISSLACSNEDATLCGQVEIPCSNWSMIMHFVAGLLIFGQVFDGTM